MAALTGVDRTLRSRLKLSLSNIVSGSCKSLCAITLPQGVCKTVNVVPSSVVRGAAVVEIEELGLAGVLVVVVITSAAALVDCVGY